MKPSVFVASSSEAIDIARVVQTELGRDFLVTPWDQHAFRPSSAIFDSLLDAARSYDFGVFVFAPDDVTSIRGQKHPVTRDNVLFECGLFFGNLGKTGSFLITPRGVDGFRLPSDLWGIKTLTYEPTANRRELRTSLGPACNDIRNAIRDLIAEGDPRRSLSGQWDQVWRVSNSKNHPKENASTSTIWHIGDRLTAHCTTKKNQFQIQATVRHNFVTGTWGDESSNLNYFGATQLYVSPSGNRMEGKWVGFKSNNKVACGTWAWTRRTD